MQHLSAFCKVKPTPIHSSKPLFKSTTQHTCCKFPAACIHSSEPHSIIIQVLPTAYTHKINVKYISIELISSHLPVRFKALNMLNVQASRFGYSPNIEHFKSTQTNNIAFLSLHLSHSHFFSDQSLVQTSAVYENNKKSGHTAPNVFEEGQEAQRKKMKKKRGLREVLMNCQRALQCWM